MLRERENEEEGVIKVSPWGEEEEEEGGGNDSNS